MTTATRRTGRPVTVYVTAQVPGVPFALATGWFLLATGVTVGGAVVAGILLKRRAERKLSRRAREDVYRSDRGPGRPPGTGRA